MEKICETPITREDFESSLCKALGSTKNIRELKARRIAAGQGFLSTIVKVEVIWGDGSEESYVLKAPSIVNMAALMEKVEGVDVNAVVGMLPYLHKTECAAYEFLKVDRPCPLLKIFFTREIGSHYPGMIIMEDQSSTAGTIHPMKGLNLEQVLQITESLASFHCWCIQNDHWRGRFEKTNKFFELFNTFAAATKNALQKVKEDFPGKLDQMDLEAASELLNLEKFTEINESHVGIMPSVIVHGDFWSNNILLEKLPDGSIGNRPTAFIDWQMAHEGNPMEDFGRLLSFSCHSSVLESHLGTIAQRYHEVLKAGAGEKFTASLETVQRIMEQTVAMQEVFLIGGLKFALPELGRNYPNPKEGEEEILLRAVIGYRLVEKALF